MAPLPRLQDAFGQVLKDLRTERGLSQQQLALDSELDRTYISLLEHGLRQPTLSTIFQLAEVPKFSPSDIVVRIDKGYAQKIAVRQPSVVTSLSSS